MDDCLQCKTIAKENNEKAMESEITRLREQVAALTKERDEAVSLLNATLDIADAHARTIKESDSKIAALAEQNEKMRDALRIVNQSLPIGVAHIAETALSLPDIATPAINRIKREGMLEAAEICKRIESEEWRDMACGVAETKTYGAVRCAQEIRARADELTKEVKG